MLNRVLDWLYARLGRKYWLVLALGQGVVSIFVVIAGLIGISLFLRPSVHDLLVLAGVGSVLTVLATSTSTFTGREAYDLIEAWHDDPDPSDGATVKAWRAASTVVLTQYRRRSPIVNLAASARCTKPPPRRKSCPGAS